jgi:hypothetical protein
MEEGNSVMLFVCEGLESVLNFDEFVQKSKLAIDHFRQEVLEQVIDNRQLVWRRDVTKQNLLLAQVVVSNIIGTTKQVQVQFFVSAANGAVIRVLGYGTVGGGGDHHTQVINSRFRELTGLSHKFRL